LHERIAAEVKAQLEAKGKSTEGVETFEAFYGLLQSEAVMLQKKYQPALRDGIKIAVDLVNSVKEDKVDGDVDVSIAFDDQKKTVSIKPQLNTHTIEQPTRDYDSEIGKVVDFTVDSESHKIWIEERGSTVEVMMASVATPVGEKIEAWKNDIEALGEDDENYAKAKSMYSLVVQAYDKTSQTAIDLARKKAEVDASQSKTRALSGNKDNAKKGKITSEESERRKIVLEREYEEGLITAFEKVDYYVEQNEVTLKEAVKRLLLLIGDEGKVKVGDEEIERSEFTDEERKSISQYYDIAIVGVGSAAARWIHTNTKTYNKGIIIGKIGGWNDRGQETTSHPKTIVSPMTPTPEEQSKSGLIDKDGETIFERADDHVDDIKYLVKQSGFKHLEETSKSIRKKGEWSLINYGNNKQAIAARKIILATGAGPEHEAAREMENEEDTELKYKKVVTLNQFMNEVETLKPKPLAERKAILGQRKVLIFGGNAAWDAINTAEKLGFDVHPRSRRGFTQILPGTKNTAGKVLFDEQINNEEKKKEYIAGYYERHEISNGKVTVSFTGQGCFILAN
jgi:hypothetical protein